MAPGAGAGIARCALPAALVLAAGLGQPARAADAGPTRQEPPHVAVSGPIGDRLSGEAPLGPDAPGPQAFLEPPADLGGEARQRFAAGGAIFRKIWVSAPSSTTASDGLGPLFNARSCAQCHVRGGRAVPPPDDGRPAPPAPGLVMRLSIAPRSAGERAELTSGGLRVVPEPTYGVQLQPRAVQGHSGEGRLEVGYSEQPVTLGDGQIVHLRRPHYSVTGLAYGPLDGTTMTSPRIAPALIGLGLLEAVPDEAIEAWEDPLDRNGDGIAGRASRALPTEAGAPAVVGRFGWKAAVASLRRQVAEAFAIDMGLSSPVVPAPAGDCTLRQQRCREAPDGRDARHGGHEVSAAMLDLVTQFVAQLAVPERRHAGAPAVRRGEALFQQAGCAACHRPSLETRAVTGEGRPGTRIIWPYTDLLLHDMGEGLADRRPEGTAGGREWRTAPLWGIGLAGAVAGREGYLHDGRARSLEEAILWHGGEARRARDAFAALPRPERELLIGFLRSL